MEDFTTTQSDESKRGQPSALQIMFPEYFTYESSGSGNFRLSKGNTSVRSIPWLNVGLVTELTFLNFRIRQVILFPCEMQTYEAYAVAVHWPRFEGLGVRDWWIEVAPGTKTKNFQRFKASRLCAGSRVAKTLLDGLNGIIFGDRQ
jgi:hypothetical protein